MLRVIRRAVAGAGVLASLSCGGGDETPTRLFLESFADLRGVLASPMPLECGLGRRWSDDGHTLSFISDATIVCQRGWGDTPVDIQVELSASAETSRFRFRAMSEDLPVELDSTSSDLLLLRMTLPPLQRVVVTVSRDTSQGVPTTAGGNENHFSRIRVVANGREVARLAAPLSPQQRGLSGLLERGIGGSGQRKARGALLRGEHAVTVDVASEAPGVFWSQVHNFSSRPAIFAVELPGGPVVEERVEPWSHGTLSIQVPAGTQQIVLRGRGRPDGLYLWGAPRLGREGDRRPWVILLSLDTTRRDALGAWGGTAGDTPNLDRLASESTVFDAAW
ncbi:MAG TPA: hypothetical protein VK969_01740, partial [Acidimicrobiia bacterium]|nr:hypothetical protein [Acidimicrobiia bacterium]